MVQSLSPFAPIRDEGPFEDRHFVLHGIGWDTFEHMRESLGDGLRMTYLEGTLELMSPSLEHEDLKKLIARLLEVWALERGVDLNGYGNVTLKSAPSRRALEPDECYCVGKIHQVPDLAIEVVLSHGYVDRLEVYRGLEVREIWAYADGRITVLVLEGDHYVESARSALLPALDLQQLASFVSVGANQSERVRAYRSALCSKT